VTFSVPQIVLSDLREAVARGVAMASATPQGSTKAANGKIAFIDNTIDAATGSVSVRAVFENADDFLWAGQLCNIRVTVRVDPDVVSIPRTATQAGQIGNYVYVVENGVARVRNVKVLRFQDGRDVISEGLNGNETLVTDGALQLVDGGRVNIKKSDTEKGAI
jgi:multidrug efflux system membrane fusion protein